MRILLCLQLLLFTTSALAQTAISPKADVQMAIAVVEKALNSPNVNNWPTFIPELKDLKNSLRKVQFRQTDCDADDYAFVLKKSPRIINLCPLYFQSATRDRVMTLIHEGFHTIGHDDPFVYTFENMVVSLSGY